MLQTANMNLTKWDNINDQFSHAQLAANFQLLDDHDHTANKGLKIPAGGIANLAVGTAQLQDIAVTTAKLADTSVSTAKIASNAVTSAKIAPGTLGAASLASGSVTDVKLASPNNSVYRMVFNATGFLVNDAGAATYMLNFSRAASTPYALVTTNAVTDLARIMPLFYFVAADYTVAGKTTKLNVRSQVAVNATAPGISFNVKLYPVTVGGATADNLVFTLGSAITASTSTHTTPSTSAVDEATSGDFDVPADNVYGLGFGTTGNLATDSAIQVSAQLRVRHV